MRLTIPLQQMTTDEKLVALDEIWADLQRAPDDVPSPSWHADVLQAREGRVREEQSHFVNWAEAKSRLREQA